MKLTEIETLKLPLYILGVLDQHEIHSLTGNLQVRHSQSLLENFFREMVRYVHNIGFLPHNAHGKLKQMFVPACAGT